MAKLARRACSLLGLIGVVLVLKSLWIPAKAVLAQELIAAAYAETLVSGEAVAPWPWADTSPVARLSIPKLDLQRVVLADASPRTLAFGPGLLGGAPNASSGLSIAGHRDTHFAFLGQLQVGDNVVWEDRFGKRQFRIESRQIADIRLHRIARPGADEMQLSTCWPLQNWQPRGPLRLLLVARETTVRYDTISTPSQRSL